MFLRMRLLIALGTILCVLNILFPVDGLTTPSQLVYLGIFLLYLPIELIIYGTLYFLIIVICRRVNLKIPKDAT